MPQMASTAVNSISLGSAGVAAGDTMELYQDSAELTHVEVHVPRLSALILLLALPFVLLTGCHSILGPALAEEASIGSTAAKPHVSEEWRPTLKSLKVWVAGPFLKIHGVLDEHASVDYGNDGWTVQTILDTDQNNYTGMYGCCGFDYVVRRGVSLRCHRIWARLN
jgi:hypothetical protein